MMRPYTVNSAQQLDPLITHEAKNKAMQTHGAFETEEF
jgi:hypothetical protein